MFQFMKALPAPAPVPVPWRLLCAVRRALELFGPNLFEQDATLHYPRSLYMSFVTIYFLFVWKSLLQLAVNFMLCPLSICT